MNFNLKEKYFSPAFSLGSMLIVQLVLSMDLQAQGLFVRGAKELLNPRTMASKFKTAAVKVAGTTTRVLADKTPLRKIAKMPCATNCLALTKSLNERFKKSPELFQGQMLEIYPSQLASHLQELGKSPSAFSPEVIDNVILDQDFGGKLAKAKEKAAICGEVIARTAPLTLGMKLVPLLFSRLALYDFLNAPLVFGATVGIQSLTVPAMGAACYLYLKHKDDQNHEMLIRSLAERFAEQRRKLGITMDNTPRLNAPVEVDTEAVSVKSESANQQQNNSKSGKL